jgi:hypothetical protein
MLMLPVPFIVGVPRSGTTMLRLMLDAHSELAIPPKTMFLNLFLRSNCKQLSIHEFVYQLADSPRWAVFGFEHDELINSMGAILKKSSANIPELIRSHYQAYAQKQGKTRWGGEKSGIQLKSMLEISLVLPEAHFIHIIRDARSVVLSLKKAYFTKNRNVVALANNWVTSITKAREKAQKLPHYVEIKYEDLVLSTELNLQSICKFIDLPYQSSMLNYYQNASSRLEELKRDPQYGDYKTADEKINELFPLISKSPDISRIDAWKKELSFAEIREIESIAGKLLTDLGYKTN